MELEKNLDKTLDSLSLNFHSCKWLILQKTEDQGSDSFSGDRGRIWAGPEDFTDRKANLLQSFLVIARLSSQMK